VGQYPLTAQLSGTAAGNYALTISGNPTLTITQASTTTVVNASNTQPSLGNSVTLTATVASTVVGAPAPAGSVTFYNGSASLGTAALSAGKASISTSTLAAGSQSITATYAGNADDNSSTSAALTVNVVAPDYTISASPSTVTIQAGNRAYVTFTVNGNQAFSGSVTFSCSGLPAYSTCTFTPGTLSFTAGGGTTGQSQTSLLEIATSGSANSGMSQTKRPMEDARTALALIFMPGLLFVGLIRRRRLNGAWRALVLVAGLTLGLCAAGEVSGCTANTTATNTVATPSGASTISISAQAGSLAHTATFTLNITRAQ
jgi:plastocyanin